MTRAVVGEPLARRFGLPYWQVATTASDANRFVLRWARAITGRPRCWCSTAAITARSTTPLVRLRRRTHRATPRACWARCTTSPASTRGRRVQRPRRAGGRARRPATSPACWRAGDDQHRHGAARTRFPRRAARADPPPWHAADHRRDAHHLAPDPAAARAPSASSPISRDRQADRRRPALRGSTASAPGSPPAPKRATRRQGAGHSGIGTTLSGNPLALAALRANLEQVMTDDGLCAHARAGGAARGRPRARLIERHGLAWSVTRARRTREFRFCARRRVTAPRPEAAIDPALEQLLHLYLLNRGVVITPFHNMMLVCPATTADDVSRCSTRSIPPSPTARHPRARESWDLLRPRLRSPRIPRPQSRYPACPDVAGRQQRRPARQIAAPSELPAAYAQGRPLPSSSALTIGGDDVRKPAWCGRSATWTARLPVPGTLVRTPWLAGRPRRCTSMFDPELGMPAAAADPRHCWRARDRAPARTPPTSGDGGGTRVLPARRRGTRGPPQPPRSAGRRRAGEHRMSTASTRWRRWQPFFDDLYRACDAQGLPAETAISEFAPGPAGDHAGASHRRAAGRRRGGAATSGW